MTSPASGSRSTRTVSDIGEGALVERIARRIGAPGRREVWAGDDAAVLEPASGSELLTTDVLVERVDFDLSYASGADVGWKAVAANVSDIAAMGGRPLHAVATLVLPADTTVALVDDIIDGMLDAASRWDVSLVGGDISRGDALSLGLAVVGEASQPVLRSGARVDDAICVTGALGGSAAGFQIFASGASPPSELRERHLRPEARVDEGIALAAAGATAMIDLSDGLAVDMSRLCEASGVGCSVEPDSIPIDPSLDRTSQSMTLAIVGGEDFELLLTLPPAMFDEAAAGVGAIGLTRIGTVVRDGRSIGDRSLDAWREQGWDHLRNR